MFRFPNNGVTKLCDLLKAIQLSQTHHQGGSGPHNSQASIRTVQSDEFQTLLCLKVWRQNWTLRSIIFQVSFQKTYNFCLDLWFVHKSSFVQKYVKPVRTGSLFIVNIGEEFCQI